MLNIEYPEEIKILYLMNALLIGHFLYFVIFV